MRVRLFCLLAVAAIALCLGPVPASAQITTGTVSGTIKDSQGGVVPGATVVLISEARRTRSVPAVTNPTGDYVFPNTPPDTYTVEVTMDGFRTLTRAGVVVSAGERVSVPVLALEPGGTQEIVTVTAESPLVQASSGERSFAITTEQIENLPINRANFTSLTAFTPGVVSGGASAGGTRLGGAGQNNIMMDGISAMDTGNNGVMLPMNVESIGEVKILTQGYQAEYGRSSGLQITAVTKSGTIRFRGSVYDVERNSAWNANSWVNSRNGDPKPVTAERDSGYTIGGPVGKAGGNNKLFFFYAHEYRPRNNPINNGNPIRLRVPTALERAGDFSQTLGTNTNGESTGVLNPYIKDPLSTLPCNANNTAGCFQAGGVIGRIPAERLYQLGLGILSRYPLPNTTQKINTTYNYQIGGEGFPELPRVENLTQQPALRLDYQMSSALRLTWKYSGQRARRLVTPGFIQGFTDVKTPYPFITNYGVTVDYTMNPTTFIEGTYGFIRNELTGGNEGGILINDSSSRLNGLANFPLLYPDAGVVNPRYYAFQVMQAVQPPFWDGTRFNLPPVFGWGNRIGSAPPNQRYPGWLNINRTQDVAISLTKVMGRHTFKGGFYNNHSFKAQNTGAGGVANLTFQGYVNFGNDTNNALDTGFGFANAAVGVFTQYLQASQFIEGSMIYNNTEFYLQDNWKVNGRLSVDYGVRFTRQQPQYDQFQQMSNFFPERWAASRAPVLYVAGCSNGAATCSGNLRNAMDPRTDQILTAGGAANTQAAIGTPIPGSGDPLNGIRRAGDGIAKTGYTWPTLVAGPRFGVAYDLTETQTIVLRGGGGLFFDRPDGNTVFSIPGNPPIATSQDLRNGQLQTLGSGLSTVGVPALVIFQYDAQVPASWQWQGGVQMALPWATSVDVSYVGNRGVNRLGAFQGGTTVNLNAVDFGAAYLPQNQDPTLAGSTSVPGAAAYTANLLRPYRGLSNINQNTTEFWDVYHSLQVSLNRRFRNGFSFGANYTWGMSFTGNTGLQKRLQHAPDGTISIRADQAEYERLNRNLDRRPHYLKANAVWQLPNLPANGTGVARVIGPVINDWQIASVLTAGSGTTYDLSYNYRNNGGNVNLTGSPDYGARIVYVGNPGSGCSDNQYAQFNATSVTGPTYGSLGLESGRHLLRGCPDRTVDLALMREIRVGGDRRLELRLDLFNAFNTVVITGRQAQIQYNSPTDLTIRNSQTLADGSIDPARVTPRTAGFGAATTAQTMRNMQVQVRFRF
ncbi:MAG: carboxypeptidase regulatory-like domain-containing protein [Acidobacteria bacterium]|nr:carboxypeptidase regulatory-like domain-containing protein [Acidobacteriota bacterium]